MRMLTINPRFAEWVFEKYSGSDTYYFDESSLVFYREGMRAVTGASSAYNTELTLKLLLMFQNYQQSGQRLSVNWNLLNSTLLKTSEGISLRMERSIREIYNRTETKAAAKAARQAAEILKEKNPGTPGMVGMSGKAGIISAAKVSGEASGRSFDSSDDAVWPLLYETYRQNAGGRPHRKIIGSIGSGRIKLRITEMREKELSTAHVAEWIRRLDGRELETLSRMIMDMAPEAFGEAVQRTMRREVQKDLREELHIWEEKSEISRMQGGEIIRVSGAERMRRVLLSMSEEKQEILLSLVREALRTGSGRYGSETESLSSLFRKYEEQIFSSAEAAAELSKVLKRIFMEEYHGYALGVSEQEILRLSENTVRVFREKQQLASRVMTIMGSRFSEPGLARQAEKELFDILIHDLELEGGRLPPEQEKESGIAQTEYERMKTFLDSRDNVLLLSRKISSLDESHLKHLKEWVKKYQSVESVKTEKKFREETRRQIINTKTDIVHSLRDSENRLEQEKRELILQVRNRLGEEAAKQLEQYFERRELVTGQTLISQAGERTEETVKAIKTIMNSYMGIIKKEDILMKLNPSGHVMLANRIRENVHEPVSRTAVEARRRLSAVMSTVRRNYDFNQRNSRFFSELSEQIEMGTLTNMLRRDTQIRLRPETWEPGQTAVQINEAELAKTYQAVQTSFYLQPDKGRKGEWGEARTELFRRQGRQETQIDETRATVKTLSEKLKIQEKLLTELSKQPRRPEAVRPVDVNALTKQVMKKMESELRLEKMRRGLL